MPGVADIKIDRLPEMRDPRGVLVVAELAKFVPFAVARLFCVYDVPAGSVRGQHAHKLCHQYMMCMQGRLRVEVHDGRASRTLELSPSEAVLVEPGIFATETYLDPGTMLMVLCDRPYEKEDYLHTMSDFLEYLQRRPAT